MKPAPVIGACLALILSACSGEAPAPGDDALEAALAEISQENIYAHLAYLADDSLEGRLTGEPGYDIAAEYVARQFEAIGMEPGGDDGWYQQVPFVAYQIDTENNAFVVHRDEGDVAYEYREHYTAFADKVRTENSVRAEVVYVGFGVHAPEHGYSDLDGVDVDGKIVALFGNAPSTLPSYERAYHASSRTKSAELVKRGAIGAISLRSQRSVKSYPWERVRKTAGLKPAMAWVGPAGAVSDYFPEIEGSVLISVATAEELFAGSPISFTEARAATESDTPASVPLGFEVTVERRTTHERFESPNVIGIVRGSDPELADEYVVFTGHLDHIGIGVPVEASDDEIYNGAYDNALGIAMLIEAARALQASPPRRSVMFIALTGEERGLLGSDYFAHYPTVPAESLVANVNLDMPLFLFPVAELVDFGAAHSSLKAPMTAAAEAEGFKLVPDPMPEENLFIRSDQYSFVRQGIPASYLDTGFGSTDPDIDGETLVRDHFMKHYHKPSDDLARPIHWNSAVRFTRANARVGFAVANADERPSWNAGDFFGEKFGRKGVVADAD